MPISKASSNAVAPAAKGDLVVGSATNDSGVLAVGTTDQVLTVDSSTATGLKWAAAAGGAGNMVQIATGTLSGSSVVISGLSSYTDLVVFVYNTTNNTANGTFYLRVNATATNHDMRGWYTAGVYTPFGSTNDSDFYISALDTVRTSNNNVATIKLTNCKNAGFTDIDWFSAWMQAGTSTIQAQVAKGIYTKSEAVSSITLRSGGGTWSAGTYTVWGA